MNMGARHFPLRTILGLALLAMGCGQVLDTAPPDPATDAGHADSGGGTSDASTSDASTSDASTSDASTSDAGTVDGAIVGCTTDAQCPGGFVCDGVERCVDGSCVAGEPLACDDGIECTSDSCSEADHGCKYVPSDALCPGGSGTSPEICAPAAGGCIAATRCTSDGECPTSNCAGVWGCVGGVCRVAAVPTIPVAECMTTECAPGDPRADAQGWVVTRDASVCDDGQSCTFDRCTTSGACENVARDPSCGDGFSCTADRCAPGAAGADGDSGCVHTPDATICNDHAPCTEDLCAPDSSTGSAGTGCINRPIAGFCNDGATCTRDACNPTSLRRDPDGCVFSPDDARCSGAVDGTCIERVCSPATSLDASGCGENWTPGLCSFATSCDESGMCVSTPLLDLCMNNADCDDGNPCNGIEICGGLALPLRCHRMTNSCPEAPTGSCQLAVCDRTGPEPVCAFRPDPGCYVATPGV